MRRDDFYTKYCSVKRCRDRALYIYIKYHISFTKFGAESGRPFIRFLLAMLHIKITSLDPLQNCNVILNSGVMVTLVMKEILRDSLFFDSQR